MLEHPLLDACQIIKPCRTLGWFTDRRRIVTVNRLIITQEFQNSTSAPGSSVVRELKRKDQQLVIMDLPIDHIRVRTISWYGVQIKDGSLPRDCASKLQEFFPTILPRHESLAIMEGVTNSSFYDGYTDILSWNKPYREMDDRTC